MKRFLLDTLRIVFLFLFLLVGPKQDIYAAGEFGADYNVDYAVSPQGKTIVTQRVTLTNKLTNYYPKSYSLLLDSDKITQILAYDDGGVINPDIKINDGKTDITLPFNVKTVGMGKSFTFTLRYEHAGIASKNGNIWEIYIPGVANDPDTATYNVTLNVPSSFGPVAYLSPLPANGRTWTKEQMIRGGIAGAYGQAQNFSVNLTYTLTNPGVVPKKETIALPPDTAYQKVKIESLDPKPDTVMPDGDGNWIATYTLLPAVSQEINASLLVSVFLYPRKDFIAPKVDSSTNIGPDTYWQTTDPSIVQAAKTLETPKEIYDFVVATLKYDYSRVSQETRRLGATEVLKNPTTALCMEFTDLFIALARSRGIPARRNVGYAYTNNPKLRPLSLVSDVLHAWPEYFDTKIGMWVPIDPTWANTTGGVDYFNKLDFNHIVFATNGRDSERPYPAGFYHPADKKTKDIFVEFADTELKMAPGEVSSVINFPDFVYAGKKTEGDVVIRNLGGTTVHDVFVQIESAQGAVAIDQTISEILPYGAVKIPFVATVPNTMQPTRGAIHVEINGSVTTKEFEAKSYYFMAGLYAAGVLAICFVLFILFRIFKWIRSKKR